MTGKCFVLGITTLAFLLNAVVSTSPYHSLIPGHDPRTSRRILIPSTLPRLQPQQQQQPRVFFPLEVNVPDVINGILSTFRFIWGRFQSLFGIGGSEEIVGAKDPPPLTPSPALQAVPLAPDDEEYKSPVKTVSVEVDDPVRHPEMHRKTKIKNRKGVRIAAVTTTKQKKKKRKKIDLSAQWEMIAMDEGWF